MVGENGESRRGLMRLVVVSTPLNACLPVRSNSDLVGTYELNGKRLEDQPGASAKGGFTETNRSDSGKVDRPKRAGVTGAPAD